jgi:hypothetical protein
VPAFYRSHDYLLVNFLTLKIKLKTYPSLMKPFNRFFIVAALLAASTSASADNFYLRYGVKRDTGENTGTWYEDIKYWDQNYDWTWNANGSDEELYKFADVTDYANNGHPTYQMTVHALNGVYNIAKIGDDGTTNLEIGTTDGRLYIKSEDINGSEEGFTTTLSNIDEFAFNDANSLTTYDKVTTTTEWNYTSTASVEHEIKHLVLTLVDNEDGTYSLNIAHASNSNIYPGVYTFLYVTNGSVMSTDGRLKRGTGANDYVAHFDKLSGDIRVVDRDLNKNDCLNIGLRWWTQVYYTGKDGDRLTIFHNNNKQEIYADGLNGTLDFNLYQGTVKADSENEEVGSSYSLSVTDAFYDVDVIFNYDMLERDDYEVVQEDGAPETAYAVNNKEGKVLFEKTSSMKPHEYTDNMSYDEQAVLFANAYNAHLTISYKVSGNYVSKVEKTQSQEFYVKSSEFDGWSTEKAMTYTGEEKKGDEEYQVYTLDIPGDFDGAFYILENLLTYTSTSSSEAAIAAAAELEESTTETVSTLGNITVEQELISYKGSASDEDKVEGYLVLPETTTSADEPSAASDGDEESTSSSTTTEKVATDIVDFKTFDVEKATDTTSAGIPFYAISTGGAKIVFKYNATDPSKSIVQYIAANGTVSTLTGSEDITLIAPNEGVTEYYNLNGIRINGEPTAPGLYIRRAGNKATKVIIR